MMYSYLLFPTLFAALLGLPQLVGLVVTGSMYWLLNTLIWALVGLALFAVVYLLTLITLRKLIKAGYYKVAAKIFVYMSPWTWGEEWLTLHRDLCNDVNASEEEREIVEDLQNPEDFFAFLFKALSTRGGKCK